MTGDSPDLSPATRALLRSLAASAERSEPVAPSDDVLVRFACGMGDPEESEAVVQAMIRDGRLRQEVRAMHRQARELAAGRPFADPRDEALFATLWARAGTLRAAPHEDRNRSQILRRIFDALRRGGMGRFAAVRSGRERIRTEGDLPSRMAETFVCAITAQGDLVAEASVPTSELEGIRVRLSLADPAGGLFALGESAVRDGRWQTICVGYRALTGSEDPPPADSLVLSRASFLVPRPNRPLLFADLPSPTVPGSPEVVPLEVLREPRVVGETFRVAIRVPAEYRAWVAGQTLSLSLPAGSIELFLGRWPMERPDEVLSIRVEGIRLADGPFEYPSVLRAVFRPT
jgi:hypothetical protein